MFLRVRCKNKGVMIVSHNCCGLCNVKIEGLTVKSGNETLIDDVNLEFHCGELTVLIGKNGAGKTTLLRAILRERHYQGRITFLDDHGKDIEKPQIGYVPQQLDFDRNMPVSVEDFIVAASRGGLGRPVWLGQAKESGDKICEILEKMECGHLAKRRLGMLSGGELQRVLLALASEPMPDLLILDEPVSGVDMAGLDLFYKRVMEMKDEHHMAILLVSHDLGLIQRYADKVVLLDKAIAATGGAKEVFETAAFQRIFGTLRPEVNGIWR